MKTPLIIAQCGAVVALLAAAGAAYGATTRTFTQVVRSDHTSASGAWSGAVQSIFPPAVNDFGDLTFQATTTTIRDGIWIADRFSGGGFSLINAAQQDDATPNLCLPSDGPPDPGRSADVTYTGVSSGFSGGLDSNGFALGFSQPVINNNRQVAFIAAGQGGGFGDGEPLASHMLIINDHQVDRLAVRARESLPAFPQDPVSNDVPYYLDLFGSGLTMNKLTQISLPRDGPGIVSWYAKLSGADGRTFTARSGGVFFGDGRSDPCDINYAQAARQQDIGIIAETGGANVFTYASMATGPGVCRFAFGADHENGGSMIGAAERDLQSLGPQWNIATSGVTAAPGAGAHPDGAPVLFSKLKFSPGVNNAGDIVFRARSDLSAQWGVWRAERNGADYAISKVVYAADPVPGLASGQWQRFGDPVVNAQGDMTFLGRFAHEVSDGQGGVQTVTDDAIWLATPGGALTRIAQTGFPASNFDQSGFLGSYTGLNDPEMNGEGNIAFLASLDITDPTLRARLDSVDPLFVEEKGIFFTGPSSAPRSIVTSGMTLADLIGVAGDGRVIVDLKYAANETRIDQLDPLESVASGHQDGRRGGMTRLSSFVNGSNQNCTALSIAFVAVFRDPVTEDLSEGVFIADFEDCQTGGGGCNSCLCSTDPNCEFGALSLGDGPDYDQNGLVDDTDLGLMMTAMGMTQGRFDIDKDGIVGEKDLAILLEDYGKTVTK